MDVARLNFSHGAHERPRAPPTSVVREAADTAGRAVAVLADLQGPKIRLGTFADGPVDVGDRQPGPHHRRGRRGHRRPGLHHLQAPGRRRRASGDRLLVDDGKVALVVVEVEGTDVVCLRHSRAARSATTRACRCPGVAVSVPAMSDKDAEDLRFALRLGVDFVALSFVRRARRRQARPRDHARRRTSRSRSSPRSRSPRRSRTSRRSSRHSTGSWSPAATSAWSCRSSRCRWCRSAPSRPPASATSRSSWRPRCSSR